ncbi:hypothetical protein [Rhodovulum imhoffii]|uniref:hypothetical protein n=1 Tax=Rhodovulum imhoffii TaxID=365340 RepID=UPI0019142807|nr:hypothetical protein [Rhodovulum imhoffii]
MPDKGFPVFRPADLPDEFPGLAKGKIEACDPGAFLFQGGFEAWKIRKGFELACRQRLVFENAMQPCNRLCPAGPAGKVYTMNFHSGFLSALLPRRSHFFSRDRF